jgi:glycosyltransferase involved in cell wall biosynthesis
MTVETKPRLAVVLKGYPRLSETFIAQELLSLQKHGIDFDIWSLRRPTDQKRHPVHDDVRAPVHYLPEYLKDDPLRVLRGWWKARRQPGYARAWSAFLRDLRRDRTANRLRRFGQALVLAAELPPETAWLYAHFLHTPASVTRYAGRICGLHWSASAHAKDIYTTPDWDLAEKLSDLDWMVTCTAANVAHLCRIAPEARTKIGLVYHGLDLSRFPMPMARVNASGTTRILSVGRAVSKKGFDTLLRAVALLPREIGWHFTHVGGGAERAKLEALAATLGIAARVTWIGARSQDEVLALYRQADIFVLASRIAADGDRDGLPNVLMEAQSQEVACIATRVSAIPELISDGETGLLVDPDDPGALAVAIEKLIREPELRRQLAEAGARRVRAELDHERAIGALVQKLIQSLDKEPDALRLLRTAQPA